MARMNIPQMRRIICKVGFENLHKVMPKNIKPETRKKWEALAARLKGK